MAKTAGGVMRALVVLIILGLIYLLVRLTTDFELRLDSASPVILGYGALFAAGIVTAEILRPILSLLAPVSRFAVVAVAAALVWVAFEAARVAGTIPEGVLNPATSTASDQPPPRITRIPPAWDGLFRTIAQINAQSVGVIVETGTPLVVLSYADAKRLGLHPEALQFTDRVSVSDRKIGAAPYQLLSVRVENVETIAVDAAIAEKGALATSIVGLSFLNALDGAALSEGQLVLRQD